MAKGLFGGPGGRGGKSPCPDLQESPISGLFLLPEPPSPRATTGSQPPEEARETVAQARKRITIPAEYARDEHLGMAVLRMEDILPCGQRRDVKHCADCLL